MTEKQAYWKPYWTELIDTYQVRKTMKQKDKFITFLDTFLEERNLTKTVDSYRKGKIRNLVVGDLNKADVVFSAHYDTPPNAIYPIVNVVGSFTKWFIYQFVYVFILLGFMTAICFAVGLLTDFRVMFVLWNILTWGYVFQMSMGFANKNTLNDNTSGVAMNMALIDRMQDDIASGKVAFIFFDWEEKGLVGSALLSKKYPDIKLVNFDCISAGNHIGFVNKKAFTDDITKYFPEENLGKKTLFVKPAKKFVYTSDQMMFKNSMAIAALTKIPLVGYALYKAHSFIDTEFDTKNMELIENIMVNYVNDL